MKNHFLFVLLSLLPAALFAQNSQTRFEIRDAQTRATIIGATVSEKGTRNKILTDSSGIAILTGLKDGQHTFLITSVGYHSKEVTVHIPTPQAVEVLLAASEEELDEVIVESTRMNRSIRRIPTRIEILTEEIDEAAAMEPSRIAHLITHSTGIQVQTTAASSNGAVVRIQGLQGRYTKILKDGFPLYGGFSGSLDILQIPPLDLRQVEYIKGSASTLFGGGAIAGVLNLLSKRPNRDEILLHLNRSTIGSNDMNAFVSRRFGQFGFTNLASFQLHTAYDADKDGYADMPEVTKVNFNPKLFFTPNDKVQFYLGTNISNERRRGGDMRLIKSYSPDSQHFFLDNQQSTRATTQFQADFQMPADHKLLFKNSFSFYNRNVQINENAVSAFTTFGGRQVSSFSELSYSWNLSDHALVAGLNYTTENFKEKNLESTSAVKRDEKHQTASAFVNHIWDIVSFLSLESGLRTEWNRNESVLGGDGGEYYVLPRMSALIKYSSKFSSRFGGGLGYRPLTIFNEEAEPYGFKGIYPIDFKNAKAERSYGLNADVMYQSNFGNKTLLTVNQMFFFNRIKNPVIFDSQLPDRRFTNSAADIQSKGFETQIKYTVGKFTLFIGYTYTDALYDEKPDKMFLVLVPKHSIKGDLLFVEEGKWRIGWDYEFKSKQRLSTGRYTRDLFMTGLVIERTLGNFVLFFNAENIGDVRQSRYESLRSRPYNTPQFTEVWAPLDGRFLNFGLKLTL